MLNELGTVLSVFLAGVAAQIAVSPATCRSGNDWMFNSLGQSPCEVAAYLYYPCSAPNASSIPAAGVGEFYASSNHDSCVCNTVIFSLLSACSACQGAGIEAWQYWSAVPVGCSQAWEQEYPQNIPPGTKVPHWAYLPLDDGNNLAASASAIGGLPESTGTPTSTATNPPFTVSGVVANRVAGAPASSSTTSTSTSTTPPATPPPTNPVTSNSPPPTDTSTSPSPNNPSSNPSPAPSTSSSTPSPSSTSSKPSASGTSTSISTFVSSFVSNITTQINGQPTTLLTTSLSTSLSTSIASNTPALAQDSGSVHHQSDTGPIIGGVLGGLAALLILAGGAYYLWSRRSLPSSASGKVDLSVVSGSVPPSYLKPGAPATMFPQRLYDPDDPRTFPDALMSHTGSYTVPTASDGSDTGLPAYGGHSQMAQV